MRRISLAALLLCAGVQLAACGGKAPSGQVAAKVGNEEITVQEVQAEMNGFNPPDAKTRQAAQQQALQNIVQRKLLAQAATKAGIAKSPEYALQKARVDESLLVQMWENNLAKSVPQPSPEQINKFIADHPDLYASRKVFSVDQLRFPPINDPKIVAELRPLHTLEDIQRVLDAHGIHYATGKGQVDAMSIDPQVLAQIEKLPADEVFVIPAGGALIANKITGVQIVPAPNDLAAKHAAAYIKSQQARETVARLFKGVVTNPKVKVAYNKAYAPPPPPKGAAVGTAGAAR